MKRIVIITATLLVSTLGARAAPNWYRRTIRRSTHGGQQRRHSRSGSRRHAARISCNTTPPLPPPSPHPWFRAAVRWTSGQNPAIILT